MEPRTANRSRLRPTMIPSMSLSDDPSSPWAERLQFVLRSECHPRLLMKCLTYQYSGNNLIKEQAHRGMQSQSLCQLTLGLHSSRDSVYLSRVGLTIFSDLEKATRNQNRRRTHIFLPGPSWSSNPGTRPSATHLGFLCCGSNSGGEFMELGEEHGL